MGFGLKRVSIVQDYFSPELDLGHKIIVEEIR